MRKESMKERIKFLKEWMNDLEMTIAYMRDKIYELEEKMIDDEENVLYKKLYELQLETQSAAPGKHLPR